MIWKFGPYTSANKHISEGNKELCPYWIADHTHQITVTSVNFSDTISRLFVRQKFSTPALLSGSHSFDECGPIEFRETTKMAAISASANCKNARWHAGMLFACMNTRNRLITLSIKYIPGCKRGSIFHISWSTKVKWFAKTFWGENLKAGVCHLLH